MDFGTSVRVLFLRTVLISGYGDINLEGRLILCLFRKITLASFLGQVSSPTLCSWAVLQYRHELLSVAQAFYLNRKLLATSSNILPLSQPWTYFSKQIIIVAYTWIKLLITFLQTT